MHWNVKIKYCPGGTERVITKFTLIPRACENGHMHWLEKVTINQYWGSYSQSWCDLTKDWKADTKHIFKCNCNIIVHK